MELEIFKFENKEEQYQFSYKIIQNLLQNESDWVANMANAAAVLKSSFDFHWVGFYCVQNEELVLGPFQGPLACTRIPKGKGVCGTAWKNEQSLVVPNVHQFEGHIACSSLSNSEIVVPIFRQGKVIAVLDIDSTAFNTFDKIDKKYLEKITTLFFPKQSE